MGADCLGGQYAVTKSKGAIAESAKFEGDSIGNMRHELGGVAPVGETNQSGIYTPKNPSPGFGG